MEFTEKQIELILHTFRGGLVLNVKEKGHEAGTLDEIIIDGENYKPEFFINNFELFFDEKDLKIKEQYETIK